MTIKNYLIMENTNLKSIKEYADLCKVTTTTIYNRIKNAALTAVAIGENQFIDINVCPPVGPEKRGRKKLAPVEKAPDCEAQNLD